MSLHYTLCCGIGSSAVNFFLLALAAKMTRCFSVTLYTSQRSFPVTNASFLSALTAVCFVAISCSAWLEQLGQHRTTPARPATSERSAVRVTDGRTDGRVPITTARDAASCVIGVIGSRSTRSLQYVRDNERPASSQHVARC